MISTSTPIFFIKISFVLLPPPPAGVETAAVWDQMFAKYAAKYPAEAAEITRRMKGEFPEV